MNLVLFGAPGSGKGTQAGFLEERFEIPKISTGDLLREECRQGTQLGREAAQFMERGDLVPDPLVIEMIQQRLQQPDCSSGFLLDGFPRNVPQAEALDPIILQGGKTFDRVLYLRVPEEELIERLSSRLVCPICGRTYSTAFNPPCRPGVCDLDGAALKRRGDDSPAKARRRIDIYLKQTLPVLDFYRQRGLVSEIEGTAAIASVRAAIEREISASS